MWLKIHKERKKRKKEIKIPGDNWSLELTRGKKYDGLEAGVFCRVDVKRFEFLDLFLKNADVVHEGDHPIGSHRRGVETSSG